MLISNDDTLKEMSLLNKHVFIFNEGGEFLDALIYEETQPKTNT